MAVISSRPVFSTFMCISLRIVASDLMSRQISGDLCSSGGGGGYADYGQKINLEELDQIMTPPCRIILTKLKYLLINHEYHLFSI